MCKLDEEVYVRCCSMEIWFLCLQKSFQISSTVQIWQYVFSFVRISGIFTIRIHENFLFSMHFCHNFETSIHFLILLSSNCSKTPSTIIGNLWMIMSIMAFVRLETVQANLRLGSKLIYNKKSLIFVLLSWNLVKITISLVDDNAWISAWLHQKWIFFPNGMFQAQSQISLNSLYPFLIQVLDFKRKSEI